MLSLYVDDKTIYSLHTGQRFTLNGTEWKLFIETAPKKRKKKKKGDKKDVLCGKSSVEIRLDDEDFPRSVMHSFLFSGRFVQDNKGHRCVFEGEILSVSVFLQRYKGHSITIEEESAVEADVTA